MNPDRDRSWTIAPTLLWFVGGLVIALWWLDGDLSALADRLTTPRTADQAAPAGPAFAPRPVMVADTSADDDVAPAPAIADHGDRSRVGALEDVCLEGTPTKCKHWGMDGFYSALARSKQGKLGHAVRVSWYGDSVIATDAIPNYLRSKLQSKFGDGGPGFVYIVAPHRFCAHELVQRSSSNWFPHAISTIAVADRMYGVGGSTAETIGGNATFRIKAGAPKTAELYYLAQPRGGTLTVTADGTEVLSQDTKADSKQPGYAIAKVEGAKKLAFRARGRVRMFGVSLENPNGIVVDNFGLVSASAKSFANHDNEVYPATLAHRDADLVMIMIGANEAMWLGAHDRATKGYQAQYEALLAPVRKALPHATCLVISPTDQAEAKNGRYPSKPVIPVLVAAQRKAAAAAGCAFYSTYDWMGGKGSAAKWYRHRLIGSDFVHPSHAGAAKFTDALYDALITGFGRYAGT